MAATVLSGTGNVSYTNTTGGNVRVIINYFGVSNPSNNSTDYGIQISCGSAVIRSDDAAAIGKNLATFNTSSENMVLRAGASTTLNALPLELALSTSQTIGISKITGSGTAQYNILIIPENG